MESCLRLSNELFDDQDNNGEVVSSETLRNEAEKWSLKGDLNLLCTLENFSQDLATKSDTMQKNLDHITYESKIKAVKVKNLINDFQMLENCQFIENRVYDEEVEDVIVNGAMNSSDEQPKSEDPEKVKENIKKSLDSGFRFIENNLNGFKQPNQVSFDSEEEEDLISANLAAILKENRFNRTPLPHIVGSEMFMRDTFFVTSPENGAVSGVDSVPKESYDERRDEDEYISDQSSFDHETFARPVENNVEEPIDDGIFVSNNEVNNEEPFLESFADKKRKTTNENMYSKSNSNIPEVRDPFFDNIRSESDEDDDLFGNLSKKNRRPASASKSTTSKVSSESKNLFDDLDDGDLFDVPNPTSKPPPTLGSNSKPKSKEVDANEVNAIGDDFDTLNNSNFKDRLSSILVGNQPKKNVPPKKSISVESSDESIEETSKTAIGADKSNSNPTEVKDPFIDNIRNESDEDDDLFNLSKKKRQPASTSKSTTSKVSSKFKNLFDDSDDGDLFDVPSSTSKPATLVTNSTQKPKEVDDNVASNNSDFKNRLSSILVGSNQPKRNAPPKKNVSVDSSDESIEESSKTLKNESDKQNANIPQVKDPFVGNISDEDDDLFANLSKKNNRSASVSKSTTNKVSAEKSNNLFDDLDDGDLFDVPNSISKPATLVTTSKPKPKEIDESDANKSNFKDRLSSILAGNQPKRNVPPQKNISIDSSDDSMDESSKTLTNESDKSNSNIPEVKDSLFDNVRNDSDEDDDLFANLSKNRRPAAASKTTSKVSSQSKNLFEDVGVNLAGNLFADADDDDLFSIPKKTSTQSQPAPVSTTKPLPLDPVSNSDDAKTESAINNCAPLNNSMFKERAKLGAQRRKRIPTRKTNSTIAATENQKLFVESTEEASIASKEESVLVKSDSIVRETSKNTFREPLFDESDEDDLFGKSTTRTNRPTSAPKSSTTTSKLSSESKKLFDDLEDDLFSQSSKVRRDSKLKMFAADESDDLFSVTKTKNDKPQTKIADPLFDDDDDDLFSRK